MEKIRAYAAKEYPDEDISNKIRGLGLLIYAGKYVPKTIETGLGRIMPYLTINTEIIDDFFK